MNVAVNSLCQWINIWYTNFSGAWFTTAQVGRFANYLRRCSHLDTSPHCVVASQVRYIRVEKKNGLSYMKLHIIISLMRHIQGGIQPASKLSLNVIPGPSISLEISGQELISSNTILEFLPTHDATERSRDLTLLRCI